MLEKVHSYTRDIQNGNKYTETRQNKKIIKYKEFLKKMESCKTHINAALS